MEGNPVYPFPRVFVPHTAVPLVVPEETETLQETCNVGNDGTEPDDPSERLPHREECERSTDTREFPFLSNVKD